MEKSDPFALGLGARKFILSLVLIVLLAGAGFLGFGMVEGITAPDVVVTHQTIEEMPDYLPQDISCFDVDYSHVKYRIPDTDYVVLIAQTDVPGGYFTSYGIMSYELEDNNLKVVFEKTWGLSGMWGLFSFMFLVMSFAVIIVMKSREKEARKRKNEGLSTP